ncbi:hypothetical protein B0H19DRAFT_1378997 [Mycena capillaripes]|nr:hypothetical protein B0H19DRAFT_1378997 [Mycena capillaripes]
MLLPLLSLPSGPLTFCSEFGPLLKRVALHGLASAEDLQAVVDAGIKCTRQRSGHELVPFAIARTQEYKSPLLLSRSLSIRHCLNALLHVKGGKNYQCTTSLDFAGWMMTTMVWTGEQDISRTSFAQAMQLGCDDIQIGLRRCPCTEASIGAIVFHVSPSHALKNVLVCVWPDQVSVRNIDVPQKELDYPMDMCEGVPSMCFATARIADVTLPLAFYRTFDNQFIIHDEGRITKIKDVWFKFDNHTTSSASDAEVLFQTASQSRVQVFPTLRSASDRATGRLAYRSGYPLGTINM